MLLVMLNTQFLYTNVSTRPTAEMRIIKYDSLYLFYVETIIIRKLRKT